MDLWTVVVIKSAVIKWPPVGQLFCGWLVTGIIHFNYQCQARPCHVSGRSMCVLCSSMTLHYNIRPSDLVWVMLSLLWRLPWTMISIVVNLTIKLFLSLSSSSSAWWSISNNLTQSMNRIFDSLDIALSCGISRNIIAAISSISGDSRFQSPRQSLNYITWSNGAGGAKR